MCSANIFNQEVTIVYSAVLIAKYKPAYCSKAIIKD